MDLLYGGKTGRGGCRPVGERGAFGAGGLGGGFGESFWSLFERFDWFEVVPGWYGFNWEICFWGMCLFGVG